MVRRRRRRCLPVTSDSSEDVILQPRRKPNSRFRSKSNTLSNTSHKRQFENQEDNSNSDSSVVHGRRKPRNRLFLTTSDESSSSEDIVHPPRRGSKRAFSDYETGDSSDKASGSSQNHPSVRNQNFKVMKKSLKRNESSQSSGNGGVTQNRSRKKVIPRLFSSTDSSDDSSMPVYSKNSTNHQILQTSSEENSHSYEPGRRANRTYSNRSNRNMPTTSTSVSDSSQQTDIQVSTRNNYRNTASNSRPLRMSAVEILEETSSGSSEIRPRVSRHRMTILVRGVDTSSSSDSDDSFSVRRVRRGALIALRESDEDDTLRTSSNPIIGPVQDAISNKNTSTHKTLTLNKICKEFSSDSDSESEKCPICFARFTLQEVGIPACCEHNFCKVCIQKWAASNNTCPVDRQQFSSITVRAHIQGKTIEEIPIETPPVNRPWENEEWWETIATDIAFVSEGDSSSEYESLGEGPEEICCVCNRNNYMDNLILCDFCGYVYHMNCVDPPLQYLPASNWFCPSCIEEMFLH